MVCLPRACAMPCDAVHTRGPFLLQFLLSKLFPEELMDKIVKPVFAAVVLLLFVAPQVSDYTTIFPTKPNQANQCHSTA